MTCVRCGNELTGKSKKYCSPRCSKLWLKALYRKRKPEVVRAQKIRSQGRSNALTEKFQKTIPKENCLRCGCVENLR